MIYKSIIDEDSIMNVKKIVNSKVNYIKVKKFSELYLKFIINTNASTLEIKCDIVYYKEYDELSIIKVTKIEDSIYYENDMELRKIVLDEIIEDVYMVRDFIGIKNANNKDILEKDIGIVFKLKDYSMGLFINDFSPYTTQRIDFNESEDINKIYPLKKEYMYNYGELFLSYKREKISVKNLK